MFIHSPNGVTRLGKTNKTVDEQEFPVAIDFTNNQFPAKQQISFYAYISALPEITLDCAIDTAVQCSHQLTLHQKMNLLHSECTLDVF